MSTLTVSTPVSEEWPIAAEPGHTMPRADVRSAAPVRRRPSREQGMALEKLGHAFEYLVDSAMARTEGLSTDPHSPEFAAVHIMMKLNCSIFDECEEIRPIRERISRALGLQRQQMVGSVEHELHN